MPSMQHLLAEKRKRNYLLLSEKRMHDGPYRKTQYFLKAVPMLCGVAVRGGTNLVKLEKRFAINSYALLPLSNSMSEPRMSIST